jgi:hypothetical protein
MSIFNNLHYFSLDRWCRHTYGRDRHQTKRQVEHHFQMTIRKIKGAKLKTYYLIILYALLMKKNSFFIGLPIDNLLTTRHNSTNA